jgi:hypothetical protein
MPQGHMTEATMNDILGRLKLECSAMERFN